MGERPTRLTSDQLILSGGLSIRGWFAHRQVLPSGPGAKRVIGELRVEIEDGVVLGRS